ncbi:hypothetical protein L5515_004320 [Caenorhabditis briggsae]|uniref:Sdz-33 F-box domain-containing protein n=1 Tax=Caenorhabditis briggsae TaxID=6238 RepID=A0AAE9JCP3_CAEBR|nr:hypothetical protein L5515_004320 [Caenorhabditis briggsae]
MEPSDGPCSSSSLAPPSLLDFLHEELKAPEKYINILKIPKKGLKILYEHLNPVDCYNLAKASPELKKQVKKHKPLSIRNIYLRFDDEKSCVGVYFDRHRYKYTACVFYMWKKGDGNYRFWNNLYYLKPAKFQSYLYTKLTHPKEVKAMQGTMFPIDFLMGMLETQKDLCSIFDATRATRYVGVNVNDKRSVAAFRAQSSFQTAQHLRLIGSKPPKPHRIKSILKCLPINRSIRVSHQVGALCMQDELINASNVTLDDPEWLTREHVLSLNCATADIGHNNLTADDLNAFLMQWMFLDTNQIRTERFEITLSPQAFQNKKAITNGLVLLDWDPKQREGEYFDVDQYLMKSTIRDPHSFYDCKFSKDILREDGQLATVLFHGKRLHFLVWKNRFPYKILKEAREKEKNSQMRVMWGRCVIEALRLMNVQAQEEWNRKTELVEKMVKSRKADAEEEQTAKRKYFQALKEFLDTSEPKPKRKLLRTITIFKDDSIP